MPNPSNPTWAAEPITSADKARPLRVIQIAQRRAADPTLRPADAERTPAMPADNMTMVQTINKARAYLSATEITALGL